MTSMRRLFAAVLLLGIVVGAPVALWVFGRDLLPDHLPSWREVHAFFTQRDSGQLFLGALVIIGIVAWLVFTISVLVEAAAMLSGRRGQWRIPGLRVPQRAAGALLALLFTTTIAVSTAMPAMAASPPPTSLAAAVQQYQHTATPGPAGATAPTRTASANTGPALSTPTAPPRAAQPGLTWTVGRYDSLWRIAERALGDGSRFSEIAVLNHGVVQADGGVMFSADTPLHGGWVLRLPPDAAHPSSTAAPSGPAGAASTPAANRPAPAPRTVRVQSGDTLSGIAQRQLGDADLYPQLAQANHLKNPDRLDVDQMISIPAALIGQAAPGAAAAPGTRTIRVQPGDTLVGIALREYGDAGLYTRLAQANRIADPDNIMAGSTLLIPRLDGAPEVTGSAATTTPAAPSKPPAPSDGGASQIAAGKVGAQQVPAIDAAAHRVAAQQAARQIAAAAEQAAAHDAAARKAAAARQVAAAQAAAAQQAAAQQVAAQQATAAQQAAAQQAAVAQRAAGAPALAAEQQVAAAGTAASGPASSVSTVSAVSTSGGAGAAADRSASSVMPTLAVGGGAALLAGLAFGALVVARRRQFRWRRPGRAVRATPVELAAVERTLLTKGSAHVADVTWLDEAMRGLAQQLASDRSSRIPDVVAAKLTDDELELVLARPSQDAPEPWRVDDFGLRWTLDRSTALPELDRERSFGPLPALVSVGYTGAGEHWLIDLEMVGSISLTGDGERCVALLRYMAAELAHNVWSDGLRVDLVGVGDELAAANPARLICSEGLTPVLDQMRIQLDAVEEVSAAAAVDVAAGRLHNVAGDTWATQVVLVGPDAEGDCSELAALVGRLRSSRGRQAAAVVVTVNDDDEVARDAARWVLDVDAHGVLKVPALGVEMIAEQLPAAEAGDLAALLALAAITDDLPMPASAGDAEWDTFADAAGALRPEFTTAGESSVLRLAGTSPDRDGSVLPLPTHMYLAAAAVTEEDVEALAPGVSLQVREQVEWSSRTLDDDLADWWNEASATPKVTVLGPVAVRATQGQLDPQRPRLAWNTEVVLYLALMTAGVTAEQLGMDLWPDEPDAHTKSKLRNAVTTARRWLGPNPRTGRDHLPTNAGVAGARYRLEDVLVDAELFRRLRVRAVARGAEGIADLQAALRLVSGVPFTDRRPRGYGWVGPMDHSFIGMIADASHTVATQLLTGGEPERAMAAAQVALRGGSYGDDALMDCAAACFARGLTAEGESYVRRIMFNHDAEVEEDLPKHTYEVLLRRGWLAS